MKSMTKKISKKIVLWLCVLLIGIVGFPYANHSYHAKWNNANIYFTREFHKDNTQPTHLHKKIDHERAIIQSHKIMQVSKLQKLNHKIREQKYQVKLDDEDMPDPIGMTFLFGTHWSPADGDLMGQIKLVKVAQSYMLRAFFGVIILLSALSILVNSHEINDNHASNKNKKK